MEYIDLGGDLTYSEGSIKILDSAERVTRSKVIKMCKVQWSHHTEDEATWEHEEELRVDYPELFPITSFISPLSDALSPLQSRGIKSPSTPATEGTRPPPPHLRPIKGRPALGEDPHTSSAPSLSPHHALITTLLSRGSAAGETPLQCLPTHGDPVVELTCLFIPSPAPWSDLSGTRVAGGRAPVSSRAWQWPPVHGGLGRRSPPIRGLGPRVFLQKNNS
jgi:hypothetical protein